MAASTNGASASRSPATAAGLPVGGVDLDPDAVLEAMGTDKKHGGVGGGLRLVLLSAPGRPELVPAPERALLVEAIRSLATEPEATGQGVLR